MSSPALTTELLLHAYAQGAFPMADSADASEVHFYLPKRRGIIPLDAFHIPKKLARLYRKGTFEIRYDTAFRQVIEACAASRPERRDTWINAEIIEAYSALHQMGHAHSVECYKDNRLVGGLYGVTLGRAYFGESMFSHVSNASKIALIALVEWLEARGYTLLDTQFINPHLTQFGAVEISHEEYMILLKAALV